MVALSFVRTVNDVLLLREFLKSIGRSDVRIMSKIETASAVQNISEIAAVSDALMVARGDLWAEPKNPWEMPVVTCDIINAGRQIGIPVVTATQTLSSMQTSDPPSRAEVDELYFLMSSGSDAIMGSEEFAIGLHPRAVVSKIRNIGKEYDNQIKKTLSLPRALPHGPLDRELAGIMWFVLAVYELPSPNFLTHFVAMLKVYKFRPRKPVVAITNIPQTAHYFQLFQVYPVLADFTVHGDGSIIARAALKTLHFVGENKSALLIVNHVGPDTTKAHRFSRIEEIPCPVSLESVE